MLLKLNLQRFAAVKYGITMNFDSNVTSVDDNDGTVFTTSGETKHVFTANTTYTFTVGMTQGYELDSVTSNYGDISNVSGNSFQFINSYERTAIITITTKKSTSQVSIDLTSLSGWGNVANGQHSIQVVAKADNYRDSEKSTAVSFTKGVTGHTLTITNSSSSADVLQVYASTSGSWGGDLLATIAKGSTSEVNIPTDYVYFACPTAEEVFFTLSNVNPSNALVMDSGGMDYIACKINQNGSCTITIG